MGKKIAVLALLLSASGVVAGAGSAQAESQGPKNAKEAAACSAVVASLMPGLADSGVCAVQHGHGHGDVEDGD